MWERQFIMGYFLIYYGVDRQVEGDNIAQHGNRQ